MTLPNTRLGAAGVAALLVGRRRLWFIGIGGTHMSLMAQMAAAQGFLVAGSDRAAGEGTERLRRRGIPVFFGHRAERVVSADAVIYTLAVSADNPEYAAAVHLGIPVISRADFLAFLMKDCQNRIGISGCHGKSTVTAMLADIFAVAGRAPTVFCGAPLRRLGREEASGGSDCIFEACEYKDSFLCFAPTLAVVLNVDMDHVDHFATRRQLEDAFAAFAALPGDGGAVLVNAEDPAALACAQKSAARQISFGVHVGDYFAREVMFEEGRASFVPMRAEQALCDRITLRVMGEHNLSNAIAALAVAAVCGIPPQSIALALREFRGAGRRMEYRGMLCGARLFDDYAHHPKEICATLSAARSMLRGGRLFVVFQSHTYSRTAAFFTEICEALRLADRVLIAEIYAARETDRRGMSAALLAAGVGDRALAVESFSRIADILAAELSSGDVAVVMGAGDIDRLFGEFSGKHFTL